MSERAYNLPEFPYYSAAAVSPVAEPTSAPCNVCGEHNGWRYTGPFYAIEKPGNICFECIANGRAAKDYNGSFNDVTIEWEEPDGSITVLDAEGVKAEPEIIDIVTHRTPGYVTWQGNIWLFHCADGAIFLGDARKDDLAGIDERSVEAWEATNKGQRFRDTICAEAIDHGLVIYRFRCRHCGIGLFHQDMD